jgi:F-type H+-transporting ATPase subunit b
MPQLELAGYPSQIFWLTIFFIGLFMFVKTYIAPAIESLISLREGKIDRDLNAASQARAKALRLQEEYEIAHKKVNANIAEMLEGGLSNFHKQVAEQTAKVNADIALLTQKAEEEIVAQKTIYKKELETIVLDYSAFLIKRVSGLNAGREELKNFRGE